MLHFIKDCLIKKNVEGPQITGQSSAGKNNPQINRGRVYGKGSGVHTITSTGSISQTQN